MTRINYINLLKDVLLTNKSNNKCIFICFSHQMLFVTLNELVKDFVDAFMDESLDVGSTEANSELNLLAQKIDSIGNEIIVKKE